MIFLMAAVANACTPAPEVVHTEFHYLSTLDIPAASNQQDTLRLSSPLIVANLSMLRTRQQLSRITRISAARIQLTALHPQDARMASIQRAEVGIAASTQPTVALSAPTTPSDSSLNFMDFPALSRDIQPYLAGDTFALPIKLLLHKPLATPIHCELYLKISVTGERE